MSSDEHAPNARATRPHAMAEFRAMASPCRIVADDRRLVDLGASVVRDLEARWSRFVSSSEVSEVNAAAGRWRVIPADTFGLFDRAVRASAATNGAFDPLLADRLDLLRHGYGADGACVVSPWDDVWQRDDRGLDLLPEIGAVLVPAGRSFDPGGIGKGLIGDHVVERLVAAGAASVQVELGGDVRVHGECWTGGEWRVRVAHPIDRGREIAHLRMASGAVATSSAATTWTVAGRRAHHLLDPRTGLPARTDLLSATVTAAELWWAEVMAKVAVMAGRTRAPELLRRHGLAGLLVTADGVVEVPRSADRTLAAAEAVAS